MFNNNFIWGFKAKALNSTSLLVSFNLSFYFRVNEAMTSDKDKGFSFLAIAVVAVVVLLCLNSGILILQHSVRLTLVPFYHVGIQRTEKKIISSKISSVNILNYVQSFRQY